MEFAEFRPEKGFVFNGLTLYLLLSWNQYGSDYFIFIRCVDCFDVFVHQYQAFGLIKLQYDLYYIKNRSFFLDLSIMIKTLSTVLFMRGQ